MSSPDSKIEAVRALLFDAFQRHFVVLRLTFERGRDTKSVSYSAFIIDVAGDWYLVTAGHCIDEANQAALEGYSVSAQLVDALSKAAPYRHTIPFDYQASAPTSLSSLGADLGVVLLHEFHRRTLRANGATPLDEKAWKHFPEDFDPKAFVLAGVPAKSTRQTGNTVEHWLTIYPIKELESPPSFVLDPPAGETFYGSITLPADDESIVGTSGGPIFALQPRPDGGGIKYWIYAVQSRWWKSERIIEAPLVHLLGITLEQVRKKLVRR